MKGLLWASNSKRIKAHIQLLQIFFQSKNLLFKHVYLEQGTAKEARNLSSKHHRLPGIHNNVAAKWTAASPLKLCSNQEKGTSLKAQCAPVGLTTRLDATLTAKRWMLVQRPLRQTVFTSALWQPQRSLVIIRELAVITWECVRTSLVRRLSSQEVPTPSVVMVVVS